MNLCKCGCLRKTKCGRDYILYHGPTAELKELDAEKACSVCKRIQKIENFQLYRTYSVMQLDYIIRARSYCQSCGKNYQGRTTIAGMPRKEYYKSRKALKVGNFRALISERISHWRKDSVVPSDLSAEYLVELFEKQEGKCYYTAIEMECTHGKKVVKPTSVSLDKKNPNKGYVKGNVVWCTYLANTVKQSMTEEQFYEYINLILEVNKIRCEKR